MLIIIFSKNDHFLILVELSTQSWNILIIKIFSEIKKFTHFSRVDIPGSSEFPRSHGHLVEAPWSGPGGHIGFLGLLGWISVELGSGPGSASVSHIQRFLAMLLLDRGRDVVVRHSASSDETLVEWNRGSRQGLLLGPTRTLLVVGLERLLVGGLAGHRFRSANKIRDKVK